MSSAPPATVPVATAPGGAAPNTIVAPQPVTPSTQPAAVRDPINLSDVEFQRARLLAIMTELVSALDSVTSARVRQLPIVFDPNRNEINAFATCAPSGKAAIAVTDGMLVLASYLVQLQAADEVFGTQHFTQYVALVAKNQHPNAPLLPPPAGWLSSEQAHHPSKLTRQQQLNDEMLAFVLAHELGHHYLNHLPCTSILPLNAAELGLVLTSEVPAFNQLNETAADVAGTHNVLEAGRRRSGHHLTEGGALLTLRFFRALDNASPLDVFRYERTHPPPAIREGIVQETAKGFRTFGAMPWPWK